MKSVSSENLTTPDLVLLSLLAERSMHGYQANALLEFRKVRDWAGVSRPQVYYSLDKLARLGLIASAETEESAGGPERRVFETTVRGRTALADALERDDCSGRRVGRRRFVSGDGNAYDLAAAGAVSFYFNPFALNGGLRIPIRIHPRVPPGTIIGWAENLPVQYQSNEVPNVAEVKTRQDYYQIDWPVVTRQRQVGVYAEEVLAVYAPFAMGVITNIGNG